MQVVLLSGGSGTRLWPISIECCPKQFVPFLKDNESMLKLTYKNVKKFYRKMKKHLKLLMKLGLKFYMIIKY